MVQGSPGEHPWFLGRCLETFILDVNIVASIHVSGVRLVIILVKDLNKCTLILITACPFTLCRGFFTPKIVGTFYMQGYKVKEKTAIVPHCIPSFKTQWAPCLCQVYILHFNFHSLLQTRY